MLLLKIPTMINLEWECIENQIIPTIIFWHIYLMVSYKWIVGLILTIHP